MIWFVPLAAFLVIVWSVLAIAAKADERAETLRERIRGLR